MVAAAIMGAVDYTSARHKGTLNKLYKEERPVALPLVGKEIGVEDYSRGEINRTEEIKETAAPKKTIAKKAATKVAKSMVRKKKKISIEEFSRAPIRVKLDVPDTTVTMK